MSTFIVRMNDGIEEMSADNVRDAIVAWDETEGGGIDPSQIDVVKIDVMPEPGEYDKVQFLAYRVEDVA